MTWSPISAATVVTIAVAQKIDAPAPAQDRKHLAQRKPALGDRSGCARGGDKRPRTSSPWRLERVPCPWSAHTRRRAPVRGAISRSTLVHFSTSLLFVDIRCQGIGRFTDTDADAAPQACPSGRGPGLRPRPGIRGNSGRAGAPLPEPSMTRARCLRYARQRRAPSNRTGCTSAGDRLPAAEGGMGLGRIGAAALACLIGPVSAPAAQSAIDLELVVDGLERPLFVGHAGDGSGRLFVLEQAGRIRIVEDGALRRAAVSRPRRSGPEPAASGACSASPSIPTSPATAASSSTTRGSRTAPR